MTKTREGREWEWSGGVNFGRKKAASRVMQLMSEPFNIGWFATQRSPIKYDMRNTLERGEWFVRPRRTVAVLRVSIKKGNIMVEQGGMGQ